MRINESAPQISLSDLLRKLSELRGSDLHITTGSQPQVRVDGHLSPLDGYRVLTSADTKQLAYSVLTDAQKHRFEENLELDFSFGVKGLSRFRANLFIQQRGRGRCCVPRHSLRDQGFRRTRSAAGGEAIVREASRVDSGYWSNRLRKINHPRGHDRQDQSRSSRTHPDDRRPDRIPPQPQGLLDQPA